ncbi:hypothetical protein LSTR_LSTR003391 [Laodelphax striatellus]|uniref:Uncharacterized protein n=1 Tax=Laodelphax striatellus TaxID=195883 RepID=A0A482X6G7_LAOST|nr:hypothetical protein LSTR_LSTR003391 [Laodelphax striatellus]
MESARRWSSFQPVAEEENEKVRLHRSLHDVRGRLTVFRAVEVVKEEEEEKEEGEEEGQKEGGARTKTVWLETLQSVL